MRKCEEIGDVAVLEAGAGTAIKRKVGYPDGEFSYSTASLSQRRRILVRVPGEIENLKNKEDSSSNDQCNSCCSSHGSTDINKQNSEFSDLELQEEQEEDTADISTSTLYGSERRETTALGGGVAEPFKPEALEELPSEVNFSSISDEVMMPLANTASLEDDFSVAEKDLAADMNSNSQPCEVEMPLANTEVEEHFSVAKKVLTVDVNSICQFNEVKMPSMAELEEFFSVAENDLTQQFSNKYNFDFVKEEPLEGRYEWVPVKP